MTIFRRFPTIFRRFPKIFQNWPECRTNVSEDFPKISGHFPKITEDYRRRPKKIRRCFDHTPTNLSLVKGSKHHSSGTDIFTCEDILLYGKVNPSFLIGSFLVGILPYGPFPWKRSMLCIFLVFESRAGKFKLRKENVQILSSSQRNYLKD